MTREEITRMAREAGLNVGPAGMGQTVWGSDTNLKRFAALVIANHPPQSFMSYQEGFEAGRLIERESILDLVDDYAKNNTDLIKAISARGDK